MQQKNTFIATGYILIALYLFLSLSVAIATDVTPNNPKIVIADNIYPRSVPEISTKTLADAPYLRTVLPLSTIMYLRIPNLWGVLGVPNGNIFSQLVQTAPHVDTLIAIRNGVLKNVIPEIPKELQGLAELLLTQIRSPIEVAVLAPQQAKSQQILPEVLLTATLQQNDIASANAMLDSLVAQIPELTFMPLQADGNGTLLVAGIPTEVYFDVANRRLFLGSAMLSGNATPLAKRVEELVHVANHPIYAIEKGIDETGQGSLFWFDPDQLLRAAEALGKTKEVAMLRAMGIAEASSLAIGMGGSNGKQHCKAVLKMPQVGIRNLLPALHTDLPIVAAGNPETVFMLGIPTANDLTHIEEVLRPVVAEKDYQDYQAGKDSITKLLGFSVEQILSTFGNEVLAIHDQAGYYLAIGLRDSANYNKLLQNLVKNFGIKYETRKLLGTTFHHLMLPPIKDSQQLIAQSKTKNSTMEASGLLRTLVDHPTHIYWTEQQGYLLFADVPQVLMDIMYITPKVSVNDWLKQGQGIDSTGTLLLATTRASGVPQLLYEIHLWLLTYLGDLTGQNVDLFSLPSAYELGLRNAGAYSIQLTSSSEQVAVDLTYESNPLEALITFGGMPSLITAGVLASAIPAYLDKKSVNKLDQSVIDAILTRRNQLIEFYSVMNRFPSTEEMKLGKLLTNNTPLDKAEIVITPNTGVMTITISDGPDQDQKLILTPSTDPTNGITWGCSGNVDMDALPKGLCTQ